MTQFDLILTCTLTLISFWPMLIEPYFDLYTPHFDMYFDLDLSLTNVNWTLFWPLYKVWPHFDLKFDLILTYKSLTSFWPAINWPHFDLLSLTYFWPAIVWPILTSDVGRLSVMVWPDFDLQLFDLILTHNVWTHFDQQWCDLILTHIVWPHFDIFGLIMTLTNAV